MPPRTLRSSKQRAQPSAKEGPQPPEPMRNQLEAEAFAKVFQDAGYQVNARPTSNIGGLPVRDGWVVNIHDGETGFGMVGVFWGMRQFKAYTEFVGSKNDAQEVAAIYCKFMVEQRGGFVLLQDQTPRTADV